MRKQLSMAAVFIASLAMAECEFFYSENGDDTITLQGIEGTVPSKLTIPATYAGRAVSAIGPRAFKGCVGLTSLELEEGIKSIGEFAFAGFNPIGNLSSVKIPSSVTSIGRGAFTINTLTSITLADANGRFSVVDGVLYDKVDKRTICACLNVKQVTLPSDCETIGEDTFSSGWSTTSSQLETVVWPKSLTTIEQAAFHECRKLTSGDLTDTRLELIEEDEFVMCTALTTIKFPKTLKYLTGHDFSCCSSLRSVYFTGNAPEILLKTSHNKDMLDCIYVTTADLDKNYSDNTQYKFSTLSNVTTYVSKDSTGWGNVPGMWQGCPIKYADEDPSDEKEQSYTIEFANGGGIGVMPRQIVLQGKVAQLPACQFTAPSGKKRFAGWQCSNGKRYDDGMIVFNLANPGDTVTMTAIWE